MNLLTKTTLLYLLVALLVFGVGSVLTYNLVKNEVDSETDYSLMESYYQIASSIKSGTELEFLINDKVKIEEISLSEIVDTQFAFTDTLAMHPLIKRLEPHQKLTTTRIINDRAYRVEMINVFLESDDIQEVVVSIMTRLFVILGVTLLFSSFLISRWLLSPFQKALDNLRKYNVKDNVPLELPETKTTEFKQLNQFLYNMTEKVREDYVSLKEFSENASHEMQTPIAIARGKLELLLNSPDLQSNQLQLVQSAQTALTKLSKLGQGLSLISKIESQKFVSTKPIDFSKQVEESTQLFTDLAELKSITLKKSIKKEVKVTIDASLADILIGNLLKNAIQHNLEHGWIDVKLIANKLIVSNSGNAPKIDTQAFFERFRKNNQSSNSLGLGLSIVKKICDVNGLEVEYAFSDGVHAVEVAF